MIHDIHEVFAIKYGGHDRPASENYIGGDPHNAPDPLTYYVWAVVGPAGTFVVDTGFDEEVARRRNRHIGPSVSDGLKAMGIAPDSVKDIIITHLHYDHSGNTAAFPNARYHLQDGEMEYATGRCMCHAHQRMPFECDYIVDMVRKVYAGRVQFYGGDSELALGLTLHKIGGHSKGLQCVRVKTKRGYVVLASDTAHLYAHIDQGRVFPITYNVGDVLEGYQTLKKLASSRAHIVPGHDPKVMELYPAASDRLKGWAVRLDVEPKL
jgi:glyoxylase-like metal-dependent hydrolase (beta-lactamase superfamily II)